MRPIPHYFAPAASYFAAVLNVLFTNNPILAVRLVYIVSLSLVGVMVYVLVMQRVNAMAGIAAAMLYLYNPYSSLTVPHVLGNLSDVMALALIPTLLWAVNRLLTRNHPLDVLYIALATAAILLTAPRYVVIALLLCGLLTGICYLAETQRQGPSMGGGRHRHGVRVGGFLLGFRPSWSAMPFGGTLSRFRCRAIA